MAAEGPARPLRQAAPDLAVQPVPLPLIHGDMAGERVEQPDVPVGVVPEFPVEMMDGGAGEQAAALDLRGLDDLDAGECGQVLPGRPGQGGPDLQAGEPEALAGQRDGGLTGGAPISRRRAPAAALTRWPAGRVMIRGRDGEIRTRGLLLPKQN